MKRLLRKQNCDQAVCFSMYVDVIEEHLCIVFTIFQVIPEYILKKIRRNLHIAKPQGTNFFRCKEAPFRRGTWSVANQSATVSSYGHYGLH